MALHPISVLIDESPMNRGMCGKTWLADPNNRAIVKGETIMLFQQGPSGLCEFHWLTSGRKVRDTLRNTREAMLEIFTGTAAKFIYGLIPVERRDSKLMALKLGAIAGQIHDTTNGRCQVFTITQRILEGKMSWVS